ncbi:hypothetical protein COX25_01045 [bacterium (Candidatus Howlettbacteria) CG23_combo_of_CG06-09_8_20_14_all_37_9]|nr:MAG: hypothetical protein COX25_01045 [bacterium (Candidatus Howlettbacteria) CG23_combo_of_CG06-09_8_20_14_all_37_9]
MFRFELLIKILYIGSVVNMSKDKKSKILLAVVILALGVGLGFIIGINSSFNQKNNLMHNLRLEGYNHTRPLLACETETAITSEKTDILKKNIEEYISSEKSKGNIGTASVYMRNYQDGSSININGEEEYYPASLNKIPVMIATLQMARTDKNFLDKKIVYKDTTNYNKGIEVQPEKFLKSGETYSIAEAIEYMIKYSDNNAFIFLTQNVDINLYKKIFSDLKIPYSADTNNHEDYITVKDFSYSLRVLFNATYLNKELSEKALEILSKINYKDGLIAGLPNDIQVSHKFGITSTNKGGVSKKELHDCGIVYTDTPYLICVMTKDSNNIQNPQNLIKNISAMVYNQLNYYNKEPD